MASFSLVAVAALVVALSALAGVAYLGLATSPTIGTVSSSVSSTLSVTQGNPYTCGVAKEATQGSYTLEIETSSMAKIGSQVCINLILKNSGTQTVSITGDTLSMNVSDSSGSVVFHDYFAIAQPNATLASGQTYTGTTFWDTSQPSNGFTPTIGTYMLSAGATNSSGSLLLAAFTQFNITAT